MNFSSDIFVIGMTCRIKTTHHHQHFLGTNMMRMYPPCLFCLHDPPRTCNSETKILTLATIRWMEVRVNWDPNHMRHDMCIMGCGGSNPGWSPWYRLLYTSLDMHVSCWSLACSNLLLFLSSLFLYLSISVNIFIFFFPIFDSRHHLY